jgi:hypothetical protein
MFVELRHIPLDHHAFWNPEFMWIQTRPTDKDHLEIRDGLLQERIRRPAEIKKFPSD